MTAALAKEFGGGIPPHSVLFTGFLGNGERQWRGEERAEGGGDGWKGGAGVAFVCFPRFKASLEK